MKRAINLLLVILGLCLLMGFGVAAYSVGTTAYVYYIIGGFNATFFTCGMINLTLDD